MNKFLKHLIVVGLLLLSANAYSQDKNFYIFLCFGQSNMDGFPGLLEEDKGPVDERFQVLATNNIPELGRKKGMWYTAVPPLARFGNGLCPADFFGRTLVAKLPTNIKIGVVNVSVNGCKIEMYQQAHYKAYAEVAPVWMKKIITLYGGNPYEYLVEMGRIAQKSGVIKGILLHQGESNTNDLEWPKKVKEVYEKLLKDLDLKAEDVPLLAGEVVAADQKGACAPMNYIIDKLPKTIPTAYVVSAAGCKSRPPDNIHFTPAGYRELGKRYAETMLPLLGYSK
jgi:lysophospholipase L1-like esterase